MRYKDLDLIIGGGNAAVGVNLALQGHWFCSINFLLAVLLIRQGLNRPERCLCDTE